MNINSIRSRWAAVGAAVAITLGAGGMSITHATTSSGEMPIYLPLEPCRLADLRPDPFQVGPRSSALGANETYTLSGWGSVGDCTLPTGSTGLALNVTAVGATQDTFLTFFPASATRPNASNLNPSPGQPPTPNAVNVDIDGSGEFSVYNLQGNVHVIIDVVGVYDDHEHTGADIVDNSISNADTSNEPGVAFDFMTSEVAATSTPATVAATSIRVPSDGYVAIEVTGLWRNAGAGADLAFCQLQKGATGFVDTTKPWIRLDDGNTTDRWNEFSSHRIVEISSADNPDIFLFGQSISLVCDEISGDVRLDEVFISATFFATSYRPTGFIFTPLGDAIDGTATDE